MNTTEAWATWIRERFAGEDTLAMWSLTYDDRKLFSRDKRKNLEWEPDDENLKGMFKWWVNKLNEDRWGSDYRKLFKHSYFEYVCVIERGSATKRKHLHVLTSGWIPYQKAIKLWRDRVGFAAVDQIEELKGSAEYIAKYIVKYDAAPLAWFHDQTAIAAETVKDASS